jgi:hypothetical protein
MEIDFNIGCDKAWRGEKWCTDKGAFSHINTLFNMLILIKWVYNLINIMELFYTHVNGLIGIKEMLKVKY